MLCNFKYEKKKKREKITINSAPLFINNRQYKKKIEKSQLIPLFRANKNCTSKTCYNKFSGSHVVVAMVRMRMRMMLMIMKMMIMTMMTMEMIMMTIMMVIMMIMVVMMTTMMMTITMVMMMIVMVVMVTMTITWSYPGQS